MSSATIIDIQMPSSSHIRGRIITAPVWKTSVLINEIIAEVSPSLRAVKNDEPNIANPANKNEKEYIRKPRSVISKSTGLFDANIIEKGCASASLINNIATELTEISIMLFLKRLFNSLVFPAP